MKLTNKNSLGLIIAASIFISMPVQAIEKDAQLDAQIQRYWSAQVKHDWKEMYAMLTPKEQAIISSAQYIELHNNTDAFDYTKFEIKDMDIVDDLAWVAIGFDAKVIRYPDAPARHAQIWELWQKTDTWHPLEGEERQQYPTIPPKLRVAAEEVTLVSRAKAAWETKTIQDWKSFYTFLSPAYRSMVSLDEFLKKKSQYLYSASHIDWAAVTQIQKDQGSVHITFSIKPNDPAASKLEAQQQDMVESWIKQDGDWYFNMPLPSGTPNQIPKSVGAKP